MGFLGDCFDKSFKILVMSNYGGRRPGAGRKKLPNKKQSLTVRLPPWMIAWLRAQPDSSGVLIERALRNHYELKPPSDENEP